MSKRAIILAGGLGTRLRPYTVALPKPLMPIGNYPILEVIIKQLANYGFDHITLAVNHQADIIKAYFSDGSKWGLQIDYSLENKPLSTMGPLKLIPELPDDFLVMNGDVLTDIKFNKFFDTHVNNNRIFTISSKSRDYLVDYGVLKVDQLGNLNAFEEKPKNKYEVSMGIYMANKAILEYIPENSAYGFDDLVLDLIKDNKPPFVKEYEGYWLDIGRPDDYITAIDDFDNLKNSFLSDI